MDVTAGNGCALAKLPNELSLAVPCRAPDSHGDRLVAVGRQFRLELTPRRGKKQIRPFRAQDPCDFARKLIAERCLEGWVRLDCILRNHIARWLHPLHA